MPWGAIASVAGSLIGGSMQSDAAGEASDKQAQSTAEGIAESRRQYDQTRADQAGYLKTGNLANARLRSLLGLSGLGNSAALDWARNTYLPQIVQHMSDIGQPLNPGWEPDDETLSQWAQLAPDDVKAKGNNDAGSLLRKFSQSDLEADPVYQNGLKFGLDQGKEGINARALQAGSYDSGATLKALTRYGNDYGSTKANESYNRFTNDQNNIFNRLSGVSGSGQVATGQVGAAGSSAANSTANMLTDAGNARAAGIVGGANAWGNAAGVSIAR
jgi:hypothetical protein